MTSSLFDPAPVLSRLKDFQRRTVDYVFRRLYLDSPPARRFLVADEVGLGKTLVARGLIARAIEHLYDRTARIDVIYICSNAAIAAQNVNRLNVAGNQEFALATRLTLLPTQVSTLTRNKINFVSFTPGTTFDLKSQGGLMSERAILFRILREMAGTTLDAGGLLNLLQAGAGLKNWRDCAEHSTFQIDEDLACAFRERLGRDTELTARLSDLASLFRQHREQVPHDENSVRYEIIGRLRQELAATCLHALEPDLVIMDEFQRFRDLLRGETESAHLARDLFSYPGVRVLLLSATPYRMLALDHEADEDHYPEFLQTLEFLFDNTHELEEAAQEIREFRKAIYDVAAGRDGTLYQRKNRLEARLRKVMCRTERVSMTRRRDAMLTEPDCPAPLSPSDLGHAGLIDRAAQLVGAYDTVEYWKSSPYLLNFLRGYQFRRKIDESVRLPELVAALTGARRHLISRRALQRYRQLEPGNPRMRALFRDTLETGLWRLLWMPPSLPYLAPGGAFAEVGGDLTKILVFSSWNAVPEAVSALCSYEAERRMLSDYHRDVQHDTLYDDVKPLLRFSRSEGRPTGMPALVLQYPSPALASLIDPLRIALAAGGGGLPSREEALDTAKSTLAGALQPVLADAPSEGIPDQRWYWAAPALLDAADNPQVRNWLASSHGWTTEEAGHEEDPGSAFADHLGLFVQAFERQLSPPLGRPPEDLLLVLAELGLAGPGVCALRALWRIIPESFRCHPAVLSAAARIGNGFRTLFNLPESIALLRAQEDDFYWRVTLVQGLDGNLQALLDEQVHVLRESLGLLDAAPEKNCKEIAGAITDALSIRTAQLRLDEIRPRTRSQRVQIRQYNSRCRFALRLGDLRDDRNETIARTGIVRDAFNSPFRPFVLASTSIGQEGLDFHVWCHAVMHWNLPSNPVDLEQREGRIQRYKGHAVRKNLARRYGLSSLAQGWDGRGDPWHYLFDHAAADRGAGANDLVPYWIFETEGGSRIERRVPLIPFSSEVSQLHQLKRRLALYRLVFGQPRQQDLLLHLESQVGPEDLARALDWQISLLPPLE